MTQQVELDPPSGFRLDNAPFLTHTHRNLTIEGYSRAAVQSYWRIPELRLGFDLGAQPWDFKGHRDWAITHTHLDHIAALPVYLARRRMMKMEPPTVYIPEHAAAAVDSMIKSFQRLDRGRLPCNWVQVNPGDEIELSRELVMTVHPTTHTVPSVGYLVWERRNKLKPEFQHLSGPRFATCDLAESKSARKFASRCWRTPATQVRRG